MIGHHPGPGGDFVRMVDLVLPPVHMIPVLPEVAACGFTVPKRHEGERRWIF
jgi:hypothetical protein